MHVNVRHVGEVIVVDLEGNLVMGDGDELLHDVIDELLGEGWRSILLNLARVDRIDSAGVGEIAASWKLAREFEASLKLLRPGDRVRHTLHLSQILPLLEVFESEPQAVASFTTD